jgi:choline dehydrogenase-like flavoprotein
VEAPGGGRLGLPDIPVCNINATVLAVAHRAAGMILGEAS